MLPLKKKLKNKKKGAQTHVMRNSIMALVYPLHADVLPEEVEKTALEVSLSTFFFANKNAKNNFFHNSQMSFKLLKSWNMRKGKPRLL